MNYEKPTEEQLIKYADLAIQVGVNLQKNQELIISTDIHDAEFARLVASRAYKAGASKVSFIYRDELFSHLRMENEKLEKLTKVEEFEVEQRNYTMKSGACYMTIISEDPELFSDIKPEILAECSKSKSKAYLKFYAQMMKNGFRWNIIAVPSLKWAKKISPDLSDDQAINKLWQLIFTTMRLNCENPVKEWKDHQARLKKRSEFLNQQQFKAFHYYNSLGTDVTVGMPENYIFEGCGEPALDGITFCANMPTEEIFSAPHKDKINGKIFASMPLIYNGNRIEDFWFEFKDGRIINFDAKVGKEVLQNLLETDDGSHYLGEIALVPYDSPIRNLETLFYETLFDENASCHFAIGEAYPSCIKNGTKMNKKKLQKKGLNYSLEHVDFMVGTKDLKIDGIKNDGTIINVFKDGNFCF